MNQTPPTLLTLTLTLTLLCVIYFVGTDWRVVYGERETDGMIKHKQILSCFLDTPDSPFSLHSLMDYASKLGDHKPGDWFGPSQVAVLIK